MAELLDRIRSALADRYRLERELGQGGMATVYLAHDLRHERDVAIKVLRPELAATLGPQRFLQEIQIAARLTHPHILPLHDSGEAAGFLYYVMPYVEGESLRDRLSREGELPVPEAIRILREVTDALAYAHGRGVVHRDVKPENVMLSGRHALVTDFGVAKALHEATGRQRLTTAGVALGTPAYMAPEQAAADPHLDHRADIYAVGTVGYELLTGNPPFGGSSPQMILAAHLIEIPKPVTAHRPGVPPALAETIMRCLEKKPADRWQTAAELHAQLEILAATPSGGITPTSTRPLAAVTIMGGSRMARAVKLIAAGVIVAGLGFGARRLTHNTLALVPGRIVVVPFENKTGDPTQDLLGESVAERLTAAIGAEGMDAVPAAAMEAERKHGAESRAVIAQHLSARNRASVVVTGSYYRRTGGIEYRAELLRMPAGKLIVAVASGGGDPEHAEPIERFVEQTLVALVANQESGGQEYFFAGVTLPASLASFRELVRGDGLQRDEALTAFARARSLDSAWVLPLLRTCGMQFNRRQFAAAELTLAVLDASPVQLQAGDRDMIDRLHATFRGDLEASYRIARRMVARAPAGLSTLAVIAALITNRPLEALSYWKYRDVSSYVNTGARRRSALHLALGNALHILGRYQEELDLGLETEREFPEDPAGWLTMQIQARVGLGDLKAVDSLVAKSEGLRAEFSGSSRALIAGLELAAHGHPQEARGMFQRALSWVRTAAAAQATDPAQLRRDSIDVLYYAGNYSAALVASQSWLARDSTNVEAIGDVGTSAAHLGDREIALRMEARLASLHKPYLYGDDAWYRAIIFSELGDQARAMVLLRQAYREGNAFGHTFHRDPELNRLRGYPPFEEFIRPKG